MQALVPQTISWNHSRCLLLRACHYTLLRQILSLRPPLGLATQRGSSSGCLLGPTSPLLLKVVPCSVLHITLVRQSTVGPDLALLCGLIGQGSLAACARLKLCINRLRLVSEVCILCASVCRRSHLEAADRILSDQAVLRTKVKRTAASQVTVRPDSATA